MQNVEFPPLDNARNNGSLNGNGSAQSAKIPAESSIASLANAAKDSLYINDKAAVMSLESSKSAFIKKPIEEKEARETLNETKEMLSENIAAAMLAQANASPKSFLSLFM